MRTSHRVSTTRIIHLALHWIFFLPFLLSAAIVELMFTVRETYYYDALLRSRHLKFFARCELQGVYEVLFQDTSKRNSTSEHIQIVYSERIINIVELNGRVININYYYRILVELKISTMLRRHLFSLFSAKFRETCKILRCTGVHFFFLFFSLSGWA